MATLEGTACDDDPALEMSGSFSHQDTQFKRIGLNDALVFKEVLISRIEIYKILVNTAKFLKGMVGGQWCRMESTLREAPRCSYLPRGPCRRQDAVCDPALPAGPARAWWHGVMDAQMSRRVCLLWTPWNREVLFMNKIFPTQGLCFTIIKAGCESSQL